MNEYTVRRVSFKVAVVGIIVAGAAEAVSSWLFDDPTGPAGKDMYLEWGLRVIRDVGWEGAAGVLLVSGIWLVRRTGAQLGSLARLVLGVLGFLLPVGGALLFLHTMSKFESTEVMMAEKLAEVAKAAMSDQSMEMEKRAKITWMHARDVWYRTGDPIKHLNEQGSAVTFVPTERETQQREETRRLADLSKFMTVGMKRTAVISTVLLVACTVTGLMLPVRRQDGGETSEIGI